MIIAVVGDYTSPDYKDLLLRVKIAFPEEKVLDLSRHEQRNDQLRKRARSTDIEDSHHVILGNNWRGSFDARNDINCAHQNHKEIFVEMDGAFRPYSYSLSI
jgi:hypothetical protein